MAHRPSTIPDALLRSEERFRTLATHSPVGIFETDDEGDCIYVNDRWCVMSGRTMHEAVGTGWLRGVHPDDRERVLRPWRDQGPVGPDLAIEYRFLRPDGSIRWVSCRVVPMQDAHGAVIGYLGTTEDITERKHMEEALRESETRYRHLLDHSLGPICMHELDGRVRFVNPAGARALGYEPKQMAGRCLSEFLSEEGREGWDAYLAEIAGGSRASAMLRLCTRTGEERIWAFSSSRFRDGDEPPYVVGHAQDVTELKRAEEGLRALSLTDSLTGLRNQRGFRILAEQQLRLVQKKYRQEGRVEKTMLLVFADMDGLKEINDRLGHAVGSEALCHAADILRSSFRDTDIVARWGGDEFAILAIEAVPGSETLIRDRLQQRLDAFGRHGARPYTLSMSVGLVTIDPSRGGTLDDWLHLADEAMYREKRARSGTRT